MKAVPLPVNCPSGWICLCPIGSSTLVLAVARLASHRLGGRNASLHQTMVADDVDLLWLLLFFRYALLKRSRRGPVLVEFFGLSARNTQRLPLARTEMLGQEHDLPEVLGVVRDLAIDGLQDGVRFAADRHPAHYVFRFE